MAHTIPPLSVKAEKDLLELKLGLKSEGNPHCKTRVLTVEFALDFARRFKGIEKLYDNFEEIETQNS